MSLDLGSSYGRGDDLHVGLHAAIERRQAWQKSHRSASYDLEAVRS